jgi:hypothetical protein
MGEFLAGKLAHNQQQKQCGRADTFGHRKMQATVWDLHATLPAKDASARSRSFKR